MKICCGCDVRKSSSEFSKNSKRKDGLNGQCKRCHSNYRKNHYIKNKLKYIDKASKRTEEFKKFFHDLKDANPCKDCNIKYPYYVMDFDHLRDKKFDISVAIRRRIC